MKKNFLGIGTLLFSILLTLNFSCSSNNDGNSASLPTISTLTITSITNDTAISSGIITSDGGANITTRGVVWNTSTGATIALSTKTTDGTGTGTFTSALTGLTPSTTYYVRTYSTNSAGTVYGNEISFVTTNLNLSSGLVAYYPFNGNANDESVNGNNGTVQGNVTLSTDRFGNSNKAYSFPGNPNSFIDCGNNPTLQIQGALSLSAWIYMDGGAVNPRIVQYNGQSGNGGYTAFVDGTSNINRILHATNYNNGGSGTGFCCSSTQGFSITSLSWHHFVYTASSTGLAKMYIDGNLVGEYQGVPVTNITYLNSLYIGKFSNSSDAWGGKLDEIRIYNRVLNTEEVNNLLTY
jgi:hypothetical protein